MIKRLKRNIQLLLISILGTTLLFVFTIFGFIEYYQLTTQNEIALNGTLYNIPTQDSVIFGQSRNVHPNTFVAEYLPISDQFIASSTNWNIDSETFNTLMNEALSSSLVQGKILNNTVEFKKDINSLRTKIAFIDLRPTQNTFRSFVFTLVSLFLASFLVLTVLTIYLSKKLVKPVEDSMQQQKQFIADASHELKNPLTILGNNVTILKNNMDQPISTQMKWIESQESEITRMSGLVHQLLYLAQGDSEHYQLERNTIDLNHLVKQVILDYEPLFFEHKRQLEVSELESKSIILGDLESLTKLIRILLDNAIKYSYENSITTISLKNNILTITNPADTLNKDQRDHLFDRFYRIDESRSKEGYGLGLAIAKDIAQKHNAKIKVTSNNQEVTFSINFDGSLDKDQKSPSDDQKL